MLLVRLKAQLAGRIDEEYRRGRRINRKRLIRIETSVSPGLGQAILSRIMFGVNDNPYAVEVGIAFEIVWAAESFRAINPEGSNPSKPTNSYLDELH